MNQGAPNRFFHYAGQDSVPSDITHLRFDPSIKVILAEAFRNLEQLVEVELHDGLEEIGEYAFYGCKSLLRMDIPSTVKVIGRCAFWGCVELKDISWGDWEIDAGTDQLNTLQLASEHGYSPRMARLHDDNVIRETNNDVSDNKNRLTFLQNEISHLLSVVPRPVNRWCRLFDCKSKATHDCRNFCTKHCTLIGSLSKMQIKDGESGIICMTSGCGKKSCCMGLCTQHYDMLWRPGITDFKERSSDNYVEWEEGNLSEEYLDDKLQGGYEFCLQHIDGGLGYVSNVGLDAHGTISDKEHLAQASIKARNPLFLERNGDSGVGNLIGRKQIGRAGFSPGRLLQYELWESGPIPGKDANEIAWDSGMLRSWRDIWPSI
jgi:hypothetical protein